MAYNGKPFFKIPRPLLLAGGLDVQTLAGDITLSDRDSLFQVLDADGANKNVTLPPEKDGRVYFIKNAGAAGDILVKDDAAGGVITLSPNEVVLLASSDSLWYVLLNVNNL
jgi:hypothetical protein